MYVLCTRLFCKFNFNEYVRTSLCKYFRDPLIILKFLIWYECKSVSECFLVLLPFRIYYIDLLKRARTKLDLAFAIGVPLCVCNFVLHTKVQFTFCRCAEFRVKGM